MAELAGRVTFALAASSASRRAAPSSSSSLSLMPRRLSSVGCRCAASGASLPFGVGPPPFFAALPFAPFFVADGCAGSGARIDGTRPGGEPSSLLLAAPNVAPAVSVAVAAPG